MTSNSSNTLIALLAGAAVGAGIGILFAPEKGSKTRRRIKRQFVAGRDELSNKYDDLVGTIKSKYTSAKDSLEDSLDGLLADGKNKTEDVIATLEAKLADLKKEVKK